ncbi:MAG: HEAT repeat domain-containing protein [Candidatus Stahlbacteria bacterium]|nr:HEAT repeat domain-containing protein [Candidatus Stahlbacteria bacterium]
MKYLIKFIVIGIMCSGIAFAQKPDTTLLKYKLEKGTMSIKEKDKWKVFLLEDILGKKVHTKGIAASRFGGERKIELEAEPIAKQIEKTAPLVTELPVEIKRKADDKAKEIKLEHDKVGFETLKLETKLIVETQADELSRIALPTEKSEKEASKVAAIKALGIVGTESAILHLKESLKEERPEIKHAAAEALAKLGDTAGIEMLNEALNEGETSDRVGVIKSLGRAGRVTSVPPLRGLLGNEEKRIGREAAMALAKMGDEKGIAVLYDLLKSGTADEKLEIAVVLAEIEDKTGIEVLKGNLKGMRADIRLKAIRALGIIGDKSILPLLEDIMRKDPDSGVRIAASESILVIKRRGK